MESVSSPPPASSTLAPPPLDSAASGTRSLQRFDLARSLGSLARAGTAAPAPAAPMSAARTAKMVVFDLASRSASTAKMVVFDRVRRLPMPGLAPAQPASASVVVAAAWAMAGSLALAVVASCAFAAAYLVFFPHL